MSHKIYSAVTAFLLFPAALLASTPELSDLRVFYGGENRIQSFSPSTSSYDITVPSVGDVMVSATPADGRSSVSFNANEKVYTNHSVIPLWQPDNTLTVALDNGISHHEYNLSIHCQSSLSFDPRQLSIYQIMPASFQREETGVPGFTAFWGPVGGRTDGNIKGITKSLDYISDLGFNAIWLTPVFDNRGGAGGEILQATGYTITDYFSIDPRFGTDEEFRELIREAHKRDIYVILDVPTGHSGYNVKPSPSGNTLDESDAMDVPNIKGVEPGNLRFPGSLEYFKEMFRYWMEEYEVDGWRLDVAIQTIQNDHNYWKELREVVDDVCAGRRAEGHRWGALGYMVAEDWYYPGEVESVRNDGVKSCFDLQSFDLMLYDSANPEIVRTMYQDPLSRGFDYGVIPNMVIGNHDRKRIGEIYPDVHELFYHYCYLGFYSGPVSLFYNDEFGVKGGEGNPNDRGRVSGKLAADTPEEQWLYDSVRKLFNLRRSHPAMWRGTSKIEFDTKKAEIRKTDPVTGEEIVLVMPRYDTTYTFEDGTVDLLTGEKLSGEKSLKAFRPVAFIPKR